MKSNRAPAKVQSALLEAMQERQVTIGDTSYKLDEPFLVLATQNPIEQEGTYPLPEAQVDRFMLMLKIGYPSPAEEREIMDRNTAVEKISVEQVISPEDIVRARSVVRSVYIDDKVKNISSISFFPRAEPEKYGLGDLKDLIAFGASPRATIYLNLAAKAHAFLKGRGYVTPEDIKSIGHDVLRHRVLLTYEAEAEEMSSDDIVQRVFKHDRGSVGDVPAAMIPRELLKKIRHIEIRTKRLVNDLFSGEYHSTFKGQGMEFEEVRQYQPGDDIRLIDWNVTARTGYPYVKKFREERELSVVLLVDASSSGRFGTRDRFKSDTAAELCALFAFSAIKNNDKVGLIIFTDRIEKFVPPQKGRSHVLRLIREILYFEPEGTGTDVSGALEYFSKVIRRKSVVFLIFRLHVRGVPQAVADCPTTNTTWWQSRSVTRASRSSKTSG